MDLGKPDRPPFKKCPMCGYRWESRDSFLSDPGVRIIGYQACFSELTTGCFLFNHTCAGTLAILVEALFDLYDGPIYEERKTGSPECPQHCLHKDELAPCPVRCHCAYVREIIQLVRSWPKHPGEQVRSIGA